MAAAAAAADGGDAAKRVRLVAPEDIRLSALEREFFDAVCAACKAFAPSSTVRVAGGWVRDKLMGKAESHDLDLAIDNMDGKDFGEQVLNRYWREHGDGTRRIGVIKVNPEQSKHLPVATFHYRDVSVDLNRLRSETYAQHSRIPESVRPGTLEEDAARRDFTINAMYYNLMTRRVEDPTGRGLQDLRDGVVRTPLEPKQTFLDDPLRVIRAVRFASRLGFRVAPDIPVAARDPDVVNRLRRNVTRERVGTEVDKMMGLRWRAADAVRLMCEWGLFDVVFGAPGDAAADANGAHALQLLERVQRRFERAQGVDADRDNFRCCLYAAVLHSLAGRVFEVAKARVTAAAHVMREGLKLPLRDVEAVDRIQGGAEALTRLQRDRLLTAELHVGRALCDARADWRCALALAAAAAEVAQQSEAARELEGAVEWVRAAGLDGCWEWAPPLNGREVQAEFKALDPPPPAIGLFMSEQRDFCLANPRVRDLPDGGRARVLQHLRDKAPALVQLAREKGAKKS